MMNGSYPHILPIPFIGGGTRLDHIHDPPGLICEPHHHLYHELDYVLSGSGVFAVGASKVQVEAGDVVYLSRGVYHWRQSNPVHPLELCNLILDDPTMRLILDAPPPGSRSEWPWWHRWTARDLNHHPVHRAFLRRLVIVMRRRAGLLPDTEVRRLLPGLGRLLALSRARIQAAHPDLHRLAWRVRHAPQRRLSLDAEAARMGVSRWWLSRVFKRYFGVSLWEYRDYTRTDRAITLLLTSDIPVWDLGRRVGFTNTAQFINTFKHLAGLTPAKLRRRYTSRQL